VLLGIPDLRIFPDPYIDFADDWAKGQKLAEHFDTLTFPALVEYYYRHTPVVPLQHAQMYTRGLLAGDARSRQALAAWDRATADRSTPPGRRLLEIGCGTAPLLVAAAPKYEQVVGVDIAFRWLVVAKKRLAEAGLDLPLICACAEALPFRPQSFDRVVAESVLEHVQNQAQVLAECQRVMQPQGCLYVATPNRLSLGPDPHTGIWAGGLLPQAWVAAQVRRQGGIPPRRTLLSAATLRQTLVQAGFAPPQVWLPAVTAEQRVLASRTVQGLVDLYMLLRRLPLSRQLLLWIGPLLYAVAEKVDNR
jgi:2-polyprenyl-3-methyl-5-hydroxy-6-metoxy-1,4-benzoquinol methylase